MNPKTKLQREVVALNDKLPNITKKQRQWALENCLEHEAIRLKSRKTYCLDCGHQWIEDASPLLTSIDGCVCPACGRKLKVRQTRKQKFSDAAYFCIITTYKGFQILRYCLIEGNYRIGRAAYLSCNEIARFWITPTGRYEIIARIHISGWYAERWTGAFELRGKYGDSYRLNAYKYYPERKYIPEVKRNGFKGDFHGLYPYQFIQLILSSTKAETLLKSKQYDLLKSMVSYGDSIKNRWPSIRICLRNGYIVKDSSIWFDHLSLLEYFNKDLLNAKYVCPVNLKKDHSILSKKKHAIMERERLEKQRLKAIENEKAFFDMKSKFFDIDISDGVIHVSPLKSVQDFVDEGKAMRHCVFSGEYYLRPDSLILSATINEQRIETVEVSLKQFKVVQSRGVCNKNTEYHDRIIELVNSNMKLIKGCVKPKKKRLSQHHSQLNSIAV